VQPWIEALPSEAPTPDERAARDEELAARRELIAHLKPDQRRALGLLGIGLSYAEICSVTGWTYTKVDGQPQPRVFPSATAKAAIRRPGGFEGYVGLPMTESSRGLALNSCWMYGRLEAAHRPSAAQ
jgi:hypothetical protein